MNKKYFQILLSDIINEFGEDKAQKVLSSFSCPINPDIQDFLINKSIDFAKKGLAATTLVYINRSLVGYYAIANKIILIDDNTELSRRMISKIQKFSTYNIDLNKFYISAPLLAQFSKNFNDKIEEHITGDELMGLALNRIDNAQKHIGGKVSYLECENNQNLISFYESHGFVKFNTKVPQNQHSEIPLTQMLRYRK